MCVLECMCVYVSVCECVKRSITHNPKPNLVEGDERAAPTLTLSLSLSLSLSLTLTLTNPNPIPNPLTHTQPTPPTFLCLYL